MPEISIDVENRSFVKQGPGPITTAFGLEYEHPLSEAGVFSFSVPKSDPRHKLLRIKSRYVRIFVDGQQVFLGVVESLRTAIAADGTAILEVSGRDMAALLDESSVAFLQLADGTSAISDAPDRVMAFATGWSITGGDDTSSTLYGRFAGESVLAALSLVRERSGDNWRLNRLEDREVEWLKSFIDVGVRGEAEGGEAVALEGNDDIFLITSLSVLEDGIDLVNRIYPYGAGHSAEGSGLTLAPSTLNGVVGDFTVNRASNYIDYTPSDYNYPVIARHMEFKDIEPLSGTDADLQSAADMLARAVFRYLERYAVPRVTYELTCVKLPRRVQPGTRVRIAYYQEDGEGTVVHDIDATLNVLSVRTRYSDDGTPAYTLIVSTSDRMPANDRDEIATRLAQGQVFQMHRQLSSNSYRTAYRVYVGRDQAEEKGEIRFLFDAETVQVQQVLARLHILQLVAPTQTAGGIADVDIEVDVSVDLEPHTHDVSMAGHFHRFGIAQGIGTAREVSVEATGFLTHRDDGLGTVMIETTEVGGTTTQTSEAGGGGTVSGTASGTVDLSGAITNAFGIHRASLLETFDVDDLEYRINGGGWTALNTATPLGSGLYELDLTSAVVNSTTLRPLSNDNTLEIRHDGGADSDKTSCMIDCTLKIREVIAS